MNHALKGQVLGQGRRLPSQSDFKGQGVFPVQYELIVDEFAVTKNPLGVGVDDDVVEAQHQREAVVDYGKTVEFWFHALPLIIADLSALIFPSVSGSVL
jgi:hypothetical protein